MLPLVRALLATASKPMGVSRGGSLSPIDPVGLGKLGFGFGDAPSSDFRDAGFFLDPFGFVTLLSSSDVFSFFLELVFLSGFLEVDFVAAMMDDGPTRLDIEQPQRELVQTGSLGKHSFKSAFIELLFTAIQSNRKEQSE